MYQRLFQSSTFCFFLTIVPILCSTDISPSPSVSRGLHYEDCFSSSSSSCGTSAVKIAYPFWGNGHPEYCGRSGFKLSCEGTHFTMTIMSKVYRVLNIDYNTSTLRLASEAFSQTDCPNPQGLYNTTLDWNLFNYTSNVRNASVYYDCPQSGVLRGAPFSFTCTGMYSNGLSFLVISSSWENQLDNYCRTKVYVVVYNSAVHDLFYNSSSVGDVLKEGFEVNWVIDEGQCQECFISGGYCGYDMTLNRSTCFCEHGAAFSTKCPTPPSKGISLKAKVGVGVAAGLMGIFIILLPLFIYLRPKKDYQSSTSFTTTKDLVSSEANPEEKSGYFGTHLFSYRELQQATNNFEKSKELGQGGFGTVYHGKLRDGREVAIKRMFEKNNKQVEQFTNELEILTRLSHKHLLTLYGCTTRRSRELLLVYEYVPNGTVADHLNGKRTKPGSLSWALRIRIAIETASALVYLHASDIIHRDVKTTNILLDGNYSVKVADFGLSRLFPLDVTHVSTTPQGSPGYVDPEYYQCYQLTDKSDVYSFGVVLAELISAKPAVDITRNRKEINLANMAINKIKKQAWDELVDPHLGIDSNTKTKEEVIRVAELAFQCLQATKVTRPSMEKVLERLSKISSEESTVGIQDVTKDEVGVSICSSLASSNGAVESNESRKAQSMTSPSANNHDSDISVTVNVSSVTL